MCCRCFPKSPTHSGNRRLVPLTPLVNKSSLSLNVSSTDSSSGGLYSLIPRPDAQKCKMDAFPFLSCITDFKIKSLQLKTDGCINTFTICQISFNKLWMLLILTVRKCLYLIVLMNDCTGAKLNCELRYLNPSAIELQLLLIHLVKEKKQLRTRRISVTCRLTMSRHINFKFMLLISRPVFSASLITRYKLLERENSTLHSLMPDSESTCHVYSPRVCGFWVSLIYSLHQKCNFAFGQGGFRERHARLKPIQMAHMPSLPVHSFLLPYLISF